jgi:hypothetical protein
MAKQTRQIEKSANAAKDAAGAAKAAVHQAWRAVQLDERSWITITYSLKTREPVKDEPFHIRVRAAQSGKPSAIHRRQQDWIAGEGPTAIDGKGARMITSLQCFPGAARIQTDSLPRTN